MGDTCDCTTFRRVERLRALADFLVGEGYVGAEDSDKLREDLVRFAYSRGLIETYRGLVSRGEYTLAERQRILAEYTAWIGEAPRTPAERRLWIEARGISTARLNQWAKRLGYSLQGKPTIGYVISDILRSDPNRAWYVNEIVDMTGGSRRDVSTVMTHLRARGLVTAIGDQRPWQYRWNQSNASKPSLATPNGGGSETPGQPGT